MGSSVKGATVLAGYQSGLPHYKTFVDAPLKFKDGTEKHSWTQMGTITELTALQRSSNIYMFHVAMHIAGITYVPHGTLPAGLDDIKKNAQLLRPIWLGCEDRD